jgi:hypothetical protein
MSALQEAAAMVKAKQDVVETAIYEAAKMQPTDRDYFPTMHAIITGVFETARTIGVDYQRKKAAAPLACIDGNHADYDGLIEEIMNQMPDSYDGEDSAEAIVSRWLQDITSDDACRILIARGEGRAFAYVYKKKTTVDDIERAINNHDAYHRNHGSVVES